VDARDRLVERLRVLLAEEPVTREISMFGGRAFMVNEKLAVCAMKQGELLIRVAADEQEALLAQPGAAQAEMGSGREMGAGWIIVDATAIDTDDRLEPWLERALTHNRAATGRE